MVESVSEMVMVETRKIRPYHRNPRKNDATVDKLVELLPRVGFNVPLVLDRQNVIVKGHSRWRAAVKLQMKEIPCVYSDADPETIKLDRLADNRVQEFSSWDKELLGAELASLNLDFAFDIGSLDFELADNRRKAPGETGEPFISDDDIRDTASLPANEYTECVCNKCGNRMFVRKAGPSA